MAHKSYAHMIESAFIGSPKAHRRMKTGVAQAKNVAIQSIAGAVTGGALGMVHARKGLDFGANKNIPADALLWAALSTGAILTAHEGYSEALVAIGTACATTYGFRVGDKWEAKRMASKGQLPTAATSRSPLPAAAPAPALPATGPSAVAAGEFGADPVMRAAELAAMARRMP